MMPTFDPIQAGTIGCALEVTIVEAGEPVDVSAASSILIYLRNPDGAVVEKTAEFVDDGTDGKIQYVTAEGDLDVAGDWRIQGLAVVGANRFPSELGAFRVIRNIPALEDLP